jgi:hypothetical protein
MLNAIVSPPKVDLCLFCFKLCDSFCFAKGQAKCKFGGIRSVANIIYLNPLNLCFLSP